MARTSCSSEAGPALSVSPGFWGLVSVVCRCSTRPVSPIASTSFWSLPSTRTRPACAASGFPLGLSPRQMSRGVRPSSSRSKSSWGSSSNQPSLSATSSSSITSSDRRRISRGLAGAHCISVERESLVLRAWFLVRPLVQGPWSTERPVARSRKGSGAPRPKDEGRQPSYTPMRTLLTIILAGLPVVLTASDYFGQVTFNGLPVPGATVTATRGERTASATTNQDGIYHFTDLVDGVWRVTVEMLGFEPVTHEIAVPAESDRPATTLTVRSLDQLSRGLESETKQGSGVFPRTPLTRSASLELDESPSGSSGSPPVDLSVLVGPTGIGAADGLLINGSLNNGAATPFALPRGIGNNRPRPPSVFTYAAGLQLGNSAWDARPFAATGSRPLKPSYTNTQALGTLEGPIRVPWLRNTITVALGYQ